MGADAQFILSFLFSFLFIPVYGMMPPPPLNLSRDTSQTPTEVCLPGDSKPSQADNEDYLPITISQKVPVLTMPALYGFASGLPSG